MESFFVCFSHTISPAITVRIISKKVFVESWWVLFLLINRYLIKRKREERVREKERHWRDPEMVTAEMDVV